MQALWGFPALHSSCCGEKRGFPRLYWSGRNISADLDYEDEWTVFVPEAAPQWQQQNKQLELIDVTPNLAFLPRVPE